MASVFISHRTSDGVEAERLAIDIRNAGHQVWLDTWEINLGDSLIEQINDGLDGSVFVIVCYSLSGINVPWMGREWMSALGRQLNGQKVKLLPALLSGGQVPAILADIKYANLGKCWSHGVTELLEALGG
jgi:hypothetical protein